MFPFIVIIVALELLIRYNILDIPYFPPPSELWEKFLVLNERGIIWEHLSESLVRMLIGYILAVLAGLGVGALLGQSSILEDMFSPILSLMMAIPTIAWVPVLLITMGLGEETVIFAIFLGGFFAIAYNTMAGMRSVDKNLIDAGRNCGLNKYQMFVEIYVPGSMVYILTGLRLGIGYSWRALVGAEMLAPLIMRGLGKMIYDARFWNDISAMLVALIMI